MVHKYISVALDRGAKLIIVSKEVEIVDLEVTYVLVKDLRQHLGVISSNFYNWPQNKLEIIGITGYQWKKQLSLIF